MNKKLMVCYAPIQTLKLRRWSFVPNPGRKPAYLFILKKSNFFFNSYCYCTDKKCIKAIKKGNGVMVF